MYRLRAKCADKPPFRLGSVPPHVHMCGVGIDLCSVYTCVLARRACDTGCERVLEVVPTSIRLSLVQPTRLTGHPVATIIKVGHQLGPPVSQGTCPNLCLLSFLHLPLNLTRALG